MKALLAQYRNLLLVLIAIVLPLLFLSFYKGDRSATRGGAGLGLQAVGHIQNRGDYFVGNIGNFWSSYVDLVRTKEDNENLRLENARLREEKIGLQGILQENARLTKLVGFKHSRPILNPVAARVIAADISPYFRVLRLRVDAESETIKPGMPVVSAEGVVGRVEKVSGRFCDIMLTIDPRSKIDVLTQVNRSRGILSGTGNMRRYEGKISYLLRRDEVEVGEVIVTSGRGGVFPKEMVVGRIVAIDTKEFGLYQSVIVEPSVDFSRLEEVYIITGHKVRDGEKDQGWH